MRILMVCLGNICRSPIAEGVMRQKIKQYGLNWTVESAGTGNYHIGEAPHQYSQEICLEHGVDISGLRASKFIADDFANYDKIYAMAHDVYLDVKHIGTSGNAPDMSNVDYFLNELYHAPHEGIKVKKNESIPDPYYGNKDSYRIIFEMIDKTCDAIIKNYMHHNKENNAFLQYNIPGGDTADIFPLSKSGGVVSKMGNHLVHSILYLGQKLGVYVKTIHTARHT